MNSFGWLQNVSLWKKNNENFETQSYDFETNDFNIYFNQYKQIKGNQANIYNYTNGSIVNKNKTSFDGKTVFTGKFNNGEINEEGTFIKGSSDSEFYFYLTNATNYWLGHFTNKPFEPEKGFTYGTIKEKGNIGYYYTGSKNNATYKTLINPNVLKGAVKLESALQILGTYGGKLLIWSTKTYPTYDPSITSQPMTSKPKTTKPNTNNTNTTKPNTTNPNTTKPNTTKPNTNQYVTTQPSNTISSKFTSPAFNDSIQTCRNNVLQLIEKSKSNKQFLTSNNINYSLLDSTIAALECQIRDITQRMPIKFVIGDVTTMPNMSTNISSSIDPTSESADPFSQNSQFTSAYQHLYNIDVNPSYSSDNPYLGGGENVLGKNIQELLQNQPRLIIEHVSLPNIYLKFVFPAAEQGDTGLPGEDGQPGPVGDKGDTGPTGVQGYHGSPPIYMQ
jgi:hypothetical protein